MGVDYNNLAEELQNQRRRVSDQAKEILKQNEKSYPLYAVLAVATDRIDEFLGAECVLSLHRIQEEGYLSHNGDYDSQAAGFEVTERGQKLIDDFYYFEIHDDSK